MIKIYMALVVLAIIQVGLIYVNVKIDIEVVRNVNWWIVFIPSILAVVCGVLLFGFSKIMNVQ